MKMRKFICILLSLVLVFGLSNSSLVFASDNTSDNESIDAGVFTTADNAFYAPTIRQMIDVNLELGNQDEEFYHALANAYLASPSLLAETISDLPAADIQYLAKAISYDLQKTNRADLAVVPSDCKDAVSSAVARLIYVEANNTDNMSLDSFANMPVFEEQIFTAEELMMLSDVSVQSITPNSTTCAINTALGVSVVFGSALSANFDRTYVVKLYKNHGTVTSLVQTKTAKLRSGYVNTTAFMMVSFADVGVYTLYAEIYDTTGILVATSSVSNPVTVRGNWRITVQLKEDRDQLGTLTLYDASGVLLYSCICLGKSVSGDPPDVYYGNTPTGECTGRLGGPDSNTYSYGLYKYISLTPISDEYFTNRSGILIHGGAEAEEGSLHFPLRATNGCIRVTNESQEQLEILIEELIESYYHNTVGNVSITEVP